MCFKVTALDDQPPPIIAIGPANQTLPVNTIAVLPCAASGTPRPAIRWLKAGRPLIGGAKDNQHTSRVMVEPSGTLVIDSKWTALVKMRKIMPSCLLITEPIPWW